MRRPLRIAAIVVACLIVILIAVPFFINVNSFRPQIESEATGALGRPVSLGNLSLSILTGAIGIDNISIADDPAFSKSPFITAKSLKVGVKLIPLIFSHRIEVTRVVLKEPQITLLKAANGTWNFSSMGGSAAKKPAQPEETSAQPPQDISVGKLEISDGRISVGNANSATRPQVYDPVNLTVTDFSMTSQFPLKLTAGLPGGGKAEVSGKAGPIGAQDAARTPFDLSLNVKGLNLATSGYIDAASGIGGLVDLDGTLKSDGSTANAAGLITCKNVKLSPKGSSAPSPVTVNYAVNTNLATQAGTIAQGNIAAGKAAAQLTGGFQTQGASRVLNLKLNAPNMPVEDLEALLPAMGVVLPSGSRLQGGTLSADLAITGPIDKTVITGPVRLVNSKLAGFDLGSKLAALQAFTGKTAGSSDTTIQNASLNARVAPEGTRADAINLTVPAIGVITGAGTISPSGALDFKMNANLQGGMGGGVTQMAGLGMPKNGIPFSIEGTTSNPKFVPNVSGMATSAAEQAAQGFLGKGAKNPLSSIFGKKKP